jgi:hypothetical protein
MTKLVNSLKDRLAALWQKEPAMVLAGATSALIGIAAAVGATVSNTTAGLIASLLVPILLGGAIRSKVTPVV